MTATATRVAGSQSSSRGKRPLGDRVHDRADPVGPEALAQQEDREQQPEVGGPGHQERLHGTGAGVGELPVVRDQEVGAGAHQLPPDEQHPEVVGGHDGHHRPGEQGHQRGVGRVARVVGEVAEGVHLHQERHRRGEQQEHGAERVDVRRELDGRTGGVARREHVGQGLGVAEVRDREHAGEQQAERGAADRDALGGDVGAVAGEQRDAGGHERHEQHRDQQPAPLDRRSPVPVGELAQLVDVDVAVGAEHQQHDREREPDLGRGDHDDEQRERLAAVQHVAQLRVEGDEVEVDRVEHQLDAHQHEHGVATGEHAVHPDREQTAGQHQRPPQRHQSAPFRRRDSTIAPTSAASSSTLSTSNGSTHIVNSVAPVVSAEPTTVPSSVDPHVVEAGDHGGREQHADEHRDDRRGQRPADREVVGPPGRRLGEHQREQQQHDDRADVDQHLHPRDELRREHQEHPGDRPERDHEPERGMHHVRGGDDEQRRAERHERQQHEDRLDPAHDPSDFPGRSRSAPG